MVSIDSIIGEGILHSEAIHVEYFKLGILPELPWPVPPSARVS